MEQILRAAGLDSYRAEQYDIHGEQVTFVRVGAEGYRLLPAVRAALTEHYPVLTLDAAMVRDPDFQHPIPPAEVLSRAANFDLTAHLDELIARQAPWEDLDTSDDDYPVDGYDVATFGEPEGMVLLPTRDPWAAFAWLGSMGYVGGDDPAVLVAAAQRWYDHYGAEPTLIGLATGFTVSRPPATVEEALRLAQDHVVLAGLTARAPTGTYARSLMELRQWALYNRP